MTTTSNVGIGTGGPLSSALEVVGTVDADAFEIGGNTLTAAKMAVLVELLDYMSIVQLDDGFGNMLTTVRFDGVNVQIVNGLGATNGNTGDPDSITTTSVNGLGNLIVGYNEERGSGDDRTGSHVLVVGQEANYTDFGGVVFGQNNSTSAPFASVVGGDQNTASGNYSTVSGGRNNTASGLRSSVTGGWNNTASANSATVSGGFGRSATGALDWVAGSLFEDS